MTHSPFDEGQQDTARLLRVIADTLGLPMAYFHETGKGLDELPGTRSGWSGARDVEDILTLIGLFRGLSDQQARQRCLAYLRSEVERGDALGERHPADPKA